MAKKRSKRDVEAILKEARERYKSATEASKDNYDRALEAVQFRFGQQWPEQIEKMRLSDPKGARPCLTLDKTNQYCRQVVNDARQNRPAIKARPVDDQGDIDVAEIIQGIVRNIEEQSYADIAYDTAIDDSTTGFGYFRILTEYADPSSFDQEIRIRRIRNRFTVQLDPAAVMPEASDAKWGFISEWLSKDEAERKYGAKAVKSWGEDVPSMDREHWCSEDGVRIAEYFRIVYDKRDVVLLSDGRSMFADDLEAMADTLPPDITVTDQREASIPRCEWIKLAATEILDDEDFPAPYIPILRVVGNEYDIEGKAQFTGMIDKSAMDEQRMYNYAASAFVERVALEPTAPYVAARGQVEQGAEDWNTANRVNHSVLLYDPVDVNGTLVPAPQRQMSAGIAQGWVGIMQHMEHSLQASLGMYAADVGDDGNEKSGRAILARQKAGDTATFHYVDNLSRAVRHAGRIIIDAIPKVYSNRKVLRIIGEDGTPESVRVDFEQQEPKREFKANTGKIQKIYNPGIGKYDVVSMAGPSFTTKRAEGAAALTEVISRSPQLIGVMGDLYFRSMDFPYADEMAERLKKMLPPQLQEQPDEATMPPEAMMAIRQRDMALAQAQQVIGELQPKAADNQAAMAKVQVDMERTKVDGAKVALERDRMMLDADVGSKQLAQVMQGMQGLGEGLNTLAQTLVEAQAKNAEAIQVILEMSVQGRDGGSEKHDVTVQALQGMQAAIVGALDGVRQEIVNGRAKALQLVRNAMGETQAVEVTPEAGAVRMVAVESTMTQ